MIQTAILPDHAYFTWLTSQIEFPRSSQKTYNDLLLRLHEKEFIWTVPGDDNRVQDALDMRTEFSHQKQRVKFKNFVSVLEILIVLSCKLEFLAGGQASSWACQLIENLGLNRSYDPLENKRAERTEEILESLVWRTYRRDGHGGFFPLNWPKEDQRKIELWYQLNAYVNEIEEP